MDENAGAKKWLDLRLPSWMAVEVLHNSDFQWPSSRNTEEPLYIAIGPSFLETILDF